MMIKGLLLSLILAGLALGANSTMAQEDTAARADAAKQAVMAFAKELSGVLKAELEKGGPVRAIDVCSETAPAIANRISLEKGWKVTRVGTRVRNPMIGTPDEWEQQVLTEFEERAANGESYKKMSYSELVAEPGGRYFRFMKAIPVQTVCVACHGTAEEIAEPVRAVLSEHYPHDQAVGYRVGELEPPTTWFEARYSIQLSYRRPSLVIWRRVAIDMADGSEKADFRVGYVVTVRQGARLDLRGHVHRLRALQRRLGGRRLVRRPGAAPRRARGGHAAHRHARCAKFGDLAWRGSTTGPGSSRPRRPRSRNRESTRSSTRSW